MSLKKYNLKGGVNMVDCLTVNDLLRACETQVQKGNGYKKILISNDEKGEGFHKLHYQFSDDRLTLNEIIGSNYEGFTADNTVILG